MVVTAEDVAAFLGRGIDDDDLMTAERALIDRARAHLPVVTAMIRAYTRGRGFDFNGEPADDLAMVIVSSTARLSANPSMMYERSSAIDDASTSTKLAVFNGWTLPELAILHRYRKSEPSDRRQRHRPASPRPTGHGHDGPDNGNDGSEGRFLSGPDDLTSAEHTTTPEPTRIRGRGVQVKGRPNVLPPGEAESTPNRPASESASDRSQE